MLVNFSGKHTTLRRLYSAERRCDIHAVFLGEGGVGDRHGYSAVLYTGGLTEGRHALFCEFILHMAVDEVCVLVVLVEVENVVGRGLDGLCALGQQDSLEHVHRLGDIRHRYPVGVRVEYVEVDSGNDSVAHGVLLIEESRIGARLHIVPGAPLVHDKPYPVLRVVALHYCGVAGDQLLHF